MFDRRYPNLCRIEDAHDTGPRGRGWIAHEDRGHLWRVAKEVCGRCPGLQCVYDRAGKALFFYLGEPARGVHRVPVFNPHGSTRTFSSHEIDQIARLIQSAKMPKAHKDAMLAQREREIQHAAEARDQSRREAKRSDLVAIAKRTRERKGMHKGYTSHFTVNKPAKARAA